MCRHYQVDYFPPRPRSAQKPHKDCVCLLDFDMQICAVAKMSTLWASGKRKGSSMRLSRYLCRAIFFSIS